MFFFLCLLFFSDQVFGQNLGLSADEVIEDLFDPFLRKLKSVDTIPTENVTIEFKFLGIPVKFDCYDGTIHSLLSIKKTSHVRVSKNGADTTIKVPIMFEDLGYGFGKCNFSLSRFSWNTELDVTLNENITLDLEMSFKTKNNKCGPPTFKTTFGDFMPHSLDIRIDGWIASVFKFKIRVPLYQQFSETVLTQVSQTIKLISSNIFNNDVLCRNIQSY